IPATGISTPSSDTEVRRNVPPGLTSIVTVSSGVLQPCGPHHCTSCSGSVHALHTSSRGASYTRLISISCAVAVSVIPVSLLHFVEVIAEAVEAALPKPAVAGQPVGGLLEGIALQARRAQLRRAASRYEAGALQHLQVLRHRLQGDRERLGQLVHGRLALREPLQDRAPSRVGEGRECGAELVYRHVVIICLVDKPLG